MTTLSGVRVVVTRSSEDADSLASALERLGAEIIRMPTIAIEFPDDLLAPAERVVHELIGGEYEWIVFSSAAGVRAFARLLNRDDFVDVFGRVHVAAVGSATVDAFRELMGREVDLVPPHFTGHDLAETMGRGSGRVLLIRPEEAPRSIIEDLERRGWVAREVPLYRTVRGEPATQAIETVRKGNFDVVTFTSGSTVRFFVELIGELPFETHHRVVVIGPSTQAAAEQVGIRVDAVADPHTTAGVVDTVASIVGR